LIQILQRAQPGLAVGLLCPVEQLRKLTGMGSTRFGTGGGESDDPLATGTAPVQQPGAAIASYFR
jgi:hypothetical protein